MLDRHFRFLFAFWIFASAVTLSHSDANAQATLKKIRLGIAATSVGSCLFTPPTIEVFTRTKVSTSKSF